MTLATSAEDQLIDVVASCYADPLAFVLQMWAWPVNGEAGPDEWQRDVLEEIGREVAERRFDGETAVNAIREAVSSGHGIGKLSPYSSVTYTPNGMVSWGMLQPGDTVFGADGHPTRIVARHEQGVQPIYRVTFDDDSSALVGLSHLWNVRGRRERRNNLPGWRTLSTEDIMELGVTRPNGTARARQWEIPVQGPAQFEAREIDLHPYVVGLWLGDGTCGQPMWTKPYPELVARVRSLGYEVSESPNGKTKRIIGCAPLFSAGVFACGSHERYIPDDYKFNTVENRRELLRGLLDSDGEVHGCGSIGYATTSERLLDDVIWLVRSLGGKAQRQPTVKQGWYPDEDGERVECRDCYRATINLDWNPFTLEHRRAAYKPSEHRYLVRWIDRIEYSHDEEAMCITVAAKDGLYLTSDFLVTHNSALIAWVTIWIMATRPHCIGTLTASTNEQLEKKTWAQVRTWLATSLVKHWFVINAEIMYREGFRSSWFCAPQSSDEKNSEAFAGQHAKGSTSFYIFDEGSGIKTPIYEVAEGGLTDGQPIILVFGNPTRNTGRFHEICFGKYRDRWNVRVIDSRTCKLPNKTQIGEWEEDYGEDSDFFRVRVRGLPPQSNELQFIDTELIRGAERRESWPLVDEPLIAGVDVSGGGAAWTVVWFRRGVDARSIPPIRIPGSKSKIEDRPRIVAILAERLRERSAERKIAAMFIDGAFGAVLVQRLNAMGFENVFEVTFGAESPDPRQLNQRAYQWAKMREWLVGGCIPKDDVRLSTDLAAPGFHLTKKDQLVLESKESMAKRGVASPDQADALSLTFAQPVALRPERARHTGTPGVRRGWMGLWFLVVTVGRIIL